MVETTEGATLVGLAAGILLTLGFFAVIWYILMVIAWWRIFTKAGEKGWKSLIPIYNMWVAYKIVGMSGWWAFLPLLTGALQGIFGGEDGEMPAIAGFVVVAVAIVGIVVEIMSNWKMAKAFKKSDLFALLTVFFPNICGLIIGFGGAQYDKKYAKK